MNEKLTPEEHKRSSEMIEVFPKDGTDWDGVSPDTCRMLLQWWGKVKHFDHQIEIDYVNITENALKVLREENVQLKKDLAQSMDHVRRILPIAETNQKTLDEMLELFIIWNEKYGLNDQVFAEKVVTLLGSKYIEKSKQVAEEQNSVD